jgi:hypothetical protein
MFGIEKNRINVLFYDKIGFDASFTSTYCGFLENDLNILQINSDYLPKYSKLKEHLPISKEDNILDYLEGKLFNIDIIIYNVSFYNKSHIDYLISLGITVIIPFFNKGSLYNIFSRDYESLTYFIFECSADNTSRPISKGMTILNTDFKKNDYYLRNLQTDTKYSLYSWIDIQIRNNKLKKI